MKKYSTPAVFLDRDGVINRNRSDYVKSWAEFEFLPETLHAIRKLSSLDLPIIVISNQSAIGRGILSQNVVDDINNKMVDQIVLSGGRIDSVFYCPHRPDENCDCRKPHPGLLLRAAEEMSLDLGKSYLVGDKDSDIYTALAVKCCPLLVKTGQGLEHFAKLKAQNEHRFHVVDNLAQAAEWIMQQKECIY
jgi:D-glycero-D-manno-heptose 1,7-bisphosphate phosphatase